MQACTPLHPNQSRVSFTAEILDVTINSCRCDSQNLSSFDFYSHLMYLSRSVSQTARAAICRDDEVVKSLRAGCDDWTPGCLCGQPKSETDLRRPLAGDVSARSEMNMRTAGSLLEIRLCYTTNGSANLRFCPCVQAYAVIERQEHCIFNAQTFFSKEISSEMRLIPSMNLFWTTI